MKRRSESYFFLKATNLPRTHQFHIYLEKDDIVIGERNRLCHHGEPKCFKTEKEAEAFKTEFLKNKPSDFDLEIFEMQIITNRPKPKFVDHNYFLNVVGAPSGIFKNREPLRNLLLAGDLVVGKGNTFAKKGRQLWFQTHMDAENHLEKMKASPAFTGCKFEVVQPGEKS